MTVVGYSIEGKSVKNNVVELRRGVGDDVGASVATTNGACVGVLICLFAAASMAAAAAILLVLVSKLFGSRSSSWHFMYEGGSTE